MLKVGIIGFGNRISGVFEVMRGLDLGAKLAAIADPDGERVRQRLEAKGWDAEGWDAEGIALYADADAMLADEKLDGVMVGTRCSQHVEMAVKVLEKGLPLFLEKPVAISLESLKRLKRAYETSQSRVVISFPLRVTPLAQLAKRIVSSGRLGTIEQVQAVNNVPYGGIYFHNWYRDESETGGLFLQKATHDFDCINYLLGIAPVQVCAMISKRIFMGDKPAGLKCADCDENRTCPESPYVIEHIKADTVQGEMCCFARDTGNEDSGSALVRYETGMHAAYTQNFFARKDAGLRRIRLLGYNGTLEFNWRSEELRVYMHNASHVETHRLDTSKLGHSGGDIALVRNFIGVMRGAEETVAPMEAGLLSALMCIRARESAQRGAFMDIGWE